MSKRRQLLSLALLSPVLAVLLVAALNPTPQIRFRLLTWETPGAPLGLWLAATALGGAALGGGASTLALRPRAERTRRRIVNAWGREGEDRLRRPPGPEPWRAEMEESRTPGWQSRPAAPPPPWSDVRSGDGPSDRVAAAPARAPGEPAPTLVVPFRVLYRPGASGSVEGSPATGAKPSRAADGAAERNPVPVGAMDDWGDAAPEKEEEW